MLYLFSGEERKSSTGSQLREMASKAGYKVLLEEWDILRNPDHDLTDKDKRQGILEQIKGGKYAVIIVTSLWHVVARDLGQSLWTQASTRRNKALGIPVALREAAEAGG